MLHSISCEYAVLLQPLRWRCAGCGVHHEQNVREEQHHIHVTRTSNNRVIVACNSADTNLRTVEHNE